MATAAAETTDQQYTDDKHHEPILQDSKALRNEIAKIGKQNKRLKEDRDAINADIQANLEKLVSKGIGKEALKRAIADVEKDETQIENLDLAYQVCRAALGKPLQGNLFPSNTTH